MSSPRPINNLNPAWSTDLCDCFSDIPSCCLTFWCPCITFGRIAEIADQGATSCEATGAIYCLLSWFLGCGCLFSCIYRTKMRKLYNLNESPCGDCLVHFCCEACALCQEYRELKTRGFDMSLGLADLLPSNNLPREAYLIDGEETWRSRKVEWQWLQ